MTREEAKRYWEVFLTEIEELKQTYSDVDWEEQEQATKIAIADMEKHIPKKPNRHEEDIIGEYYSCPNCRNNEMDDIFDNYCPRCGQALDWSKEND